MAATAAMRSRWLAVMPELFVCFFGLGWGAGACKISLQLDHVHRLLRRSTLAHVTLAGRCILTWPAEATTRQHLPQKLEQEGGRIRRHDRRARGLCLLGELLVFRLPMANAAGGRALLYLYVYICVESTERVPTQVYILTYL